MTVLSNTSVLSVSVTERRSYEPMRESVKTHTCPCREIEISPRTTDRRDHFKVGLHESTIPFQRIRVQTDRLRLTKLKTSNGAPNLM